MPLSSIALQDRFRATLLGCAVGDALGFPFEGAAPEVIARVPGLCEEFALRPRGHFRKGQYTDDTQMTLALAEAIVACAGKVDGRVIAQRFAALWSGGLIIGPGRACSEAVRRLIDGSPWNTSGAEVGRSGNGAAMRASPIGLICFDEPQRLVRESELQGVITHKDPLARAGAVAVAMAVALNLVPGSEAPSHEAWCARIAQAVGHIDGAFASEIERLPQLLRFDALAASRIIARVGSAPLGPRDWPGISPFVMPSVLMALFAVMRCDDDFRKCMEIALKAGGDTDTVAAMAGAILGAKVGCMGVPARLRRGVRDSEKISALADQLCAVKLAQQLAPAMVRASPTSTNVLS